MKSRTYGAEVYLVIANKLPKFLKTCKEAEKGLGGIKTHLFDDLYQMGEQPEFLAIAQKAYHLDAILSAAYDALRDLRRTIDFQVDKMIAEEPEQDPHESGIFG